MNSREGPTVGRVTILLVDDERSIRRVMKQTLENEGYTVIEAASASEAISLSRGHKRPIELLVTDLVMPRMDGVVMSRRLTKMRPDMKVLWVSGYGESSPSVRGDLEHSQTPFLAKPYAPGDLVRTVRGLLSQRKEPT